MEDSAHIVDSKLTTEVSHNTIQGSVFNLGPQYVSFHVGNLTLMAAKEGVSPIQPSPESREVRKLQPQSQRYANQGEHHCSHMTGYNSSDWPTQLLESTGSTPFQESQSALQHMKGQPMPDPGCCLFMQTHVLKSPKKLLSSFLDKLAGKEKYFTALLTKDYTLCFSKHNSDTILFTVDLKKDEYDYKEGEVEDHLYVPCRQENFQFDTSTTNVLRSVVSEIKSKTTPNQPVLEKPQLEERSAKSLPVRSRPHNTMDALKVDDFAHSKDESKTPSLPCITPQQCTVTRTQGGRVLVNDVMSRTPTTFPSEEVSKTSLHQELDDENETSSLPCITPQQCLRVLDVTSRTQSTPPYKEGSETSFHEELDDDNETSSLPCITPQQCLRVLDVTSRTQSTPPYKEGSETSFQEELDVVPTAICCEGDDEAEVVAGHNSGTMLRRLPTPSPAHPPNAMSRSKSDSDILETILDQQPSQGMKLFPANELVKWIITDELANSYNWKQCARLLDVNAKNQQDIRECCGAERQHYEVLDAFECNAFPFKYAPTPRDLVEKLRKELPHLTEKLETCLETATSFQLPSLDGLGLSERDLQAVPSDGLLQRLAFSAPLCDKAYIVGRFLGLSRDDIRVCAQTARKQENEAQHFTQGVLFTWKAKCHSGQCTKSAILRVLVYLKIFDLIRVLINT